MTIVNVRARAINATEQDIIILGEGVWCKRAADLAAAQYRPSILVGAQECYPYTKYEPLYVADISCTEPIERYINECKHSM